ncbi:uncharacterized protein B0H18DRAFT_1119852 [Fomitopsis serialis]|uniref:uncharacterized protein n=1 Tax=Fomitopsis serialis TaxID=139415 RepID=UPI002007753F|nr:uncharacterized protein B0H18DRAFT_1119852 [Neoantrodia serialis]KAH9924508.1 hypothetical protein B0H18DRAFT_1119852 [Neoantrodia serialis]
MRLSSRCRDQPLRLTWPQANALLGANPLKGGDTVLVLGTGGVSIFGLQIAVASGATHVINYKKTPDWEEEVLRITGGRGGDHVIEVGGAGTINKSLASTRYGGTARDMSKLPSIVLGGALVRGILVGSRTQFEALVRLINATGLKPVVDKVSPFEETRAAYAHLESQQHVGKVCVQVARD